MMNVLFMVASCPNTKRDTSLFFSNFLKTLFRHGIENSIPLQSNSSDYFRSSFVTRWRFFSTGFKALVTAQLKHSSSSFSMLIRAFLFEILSGNGMWDDPLRGLSLLKVMSSLTTLFNTQPLPFFRYVANASSILANILSYTSSKSVGPKMISCLELNEACSSFVTSPVTGSTLTITQIRTLFWGISRRNLITTFLVKFKTSLGEVFPSEWIVWRTITLLSNNLSLGTISGSGLKMWFGIFPFLIHVRTFACRDFSEILLPC